MQRIDILKNVHLVIRRSPLQRVALGSRLQVFQLRDPKMTRSSHRRVELYTSNHNKIRINNTDKRQSQNQNMDISDTMNISKEGNKFWTD